MLVIETTVKDILHIKLMLLPGYFPFFVYIGFTGRVLDSPMLAVFSLAVSKLYKIKQNT